MSNRELIGTIFFIITSFFICAIFPVKDDFQKIFVALVFFVILPVLFNEFILNKKIKAYGFIIGDWKIGTILSAYSLVTMAIFLLIASKYFGFFDYYKLPTFVSAGFAKFLLYEFIVVTTIVAMYEFYFRGFFMSIFKTRFGYWSILMQPILFLILIISVNKTLAYALLPYFLFAPFAGIIAYKSKSLFYSGVSQFLVIFFLDVISIKINR